MNDDLSVASHDLSMCLPLTKPDGGAPASCPACDPLTTTCSTSPLSCGACQPGDVCRYGTGTVCNCSGGKLSCGAP
jgi:hypothetical protein